MYLEQKRGNGEEVSYKITIADIARQAKVSVATVSRLYNHKSMVSEGTKARVQKAMLELGLEIDDIIMRGADVPSKKILINIPTISNPYYSEIVKGAQSAGTKRGYFVLINSQHLHNSFESFLYMVKHIDVNGVIILNSIDSESIDKLNNTIPLVQCAEFCDDRPELSYVGIDNLSATQKVMEHILSTGHRKVALISGPGRYKYSKERRTGYFKALEEAGIGINEDWIVQIPDVDFKLAYSACISLLNSDNRPDAVYALSDVFALSAIKAAETIGLKVPDDIIVSGFDDVDFTGYTSPSITTVRQPLYQLGYLSAEVLIDKIEKKNTSVQHIILDTEFIVRESTFVNKSKKEVGVNA